MDAETQPLAVARTRGITAALEVLVGKPFLGIARDDDLVCIGFGAVVAAPTKRRPHAGEPEYAIYPEEAAWRLMGPSGIFMGRADLVYTAGSEPEMDFEGDKTSAPGGSRFDERARELHAQVSSTDLRVASVTVDRMAGLRLRTSGGYELQISADDSVPDSPQWIFERTGVDEPRLVVTISGPDTDQDES